MATEAGGSEGGSSPLSKLRHVRLGWSRIAPLVGGSRWRVTLLAVASVLAGLFEAALLALVAAIATALAQGNESIVADLGIVTIDTDLSVLFVIGVSLALARGGLQILLAYLPASMSARAMARLRRQLFETFIDAEWSTKAAQRDGYFQSLMNAHVTKSSEAIIILGTGITAVLMFLSMLGSAFVLSVPTALILIVFSVLLFFLLRPLNRALRGHAGELSKESIEYSKGVQEVVLMAEETEVFGASRSYRDGFIRLVEAVRQPLLRTRFLSRAVPALYQSLALLLLVVALFGVSFLETEQISTLGAVVLILIRSLTYGQAIQTAMTNFDQAVPFMVRLADGIEEYRSHVRRDGGETLPPIGELAFDGVRFAYPGGPDVLKGLTFGVAKGQAVGIAGPSGAGKSSIVQLLLRLREATAGEVRVNGADVRRFRRTDWQRRIAYVPQTPQLVWGTVADNIRFFRPDLTDADVVRAARMANIHDEIVSWPKGYETVVGQRAAAVSGGQRQRLCLARALAGRPDILILDEATSALDVKSEAYVQESLNALKGEITMFIVGHRLSTLAFCDRILVVVDGSIQAFEEPARLATRSDFYREVSEISRRQAGDVADPDGQSRGRHAAE